MIAELGVMLKRDFRVLVRTPDLIAFFTVSPIIFLLLFRFVFGGAIPVPGSDYIDFVVPGVMVQTVTFGAMATGVALAGDVSSGRMVRYLPLPVSRATPLLSRNVTDVGRNVFLQVEMLVLGAVLGFSTPSSVGSVVVAIGVALLFGFAMGAVFSFIGLATRNPETTWAAGFPITAPLVFASSAYVPVQTMPPWLETFAAHQPVSAAVNAIRRLFFDTDAAAAIGLSRSPAYYVAISAAWSVGLIVVFFGLSLVKYARLWRRT